MTDQADFFIWMDCERTAFQYIVITVWILEVHIVKLYPGICGRYFCSAFLGFGYYVNKILEII